MILALKATLSMDCLVTSVALSLPTASPVLILLFATLVPWAFTKLMELV